MTLLTAHEQQEIDQANASGLPPVVFIHGLWLLSSSWDRWRTLFAEQGYATLAPGWPDEPETVAEANQDPETFAHKRIAQVTAHYIDAIKQLTVKPIVIGHSFGGLIAQMLAGAGVAATTVAIDPAPFRGVLPLPFSALKAALPVLGNPTNIHRAVPLTFAQFRFAFANVVDEQEAQELYTAFAVPASGAPLFQAAIANVNPWTEDHVDTKNPARGPLLILSGEKDNTVPWSIANASFKQQQHNPGVTAIQEMPNRGHSLVIDHGWRDVAETALTFIAQQRQNAQ